MRKGEREGLGERERLLSGIPLFLPGVAPVVVAADLPEAEPVLGEKRDALHELCALPRIEFGNDDARGSAVLARHGFRAEFRRDQHVIVEAVREGYVGGVTVVAGEIDELRVRLWG